MTYLAEPIHDGEDGSIATGGGKTGDKVQRDVGPGAMRNGEWMELTSWGLVRGLILTADRTGSNILPHILFKSRTPKPLLNKILGAVNAGMTGEF